MLPSTHDEVEPPLRTTKRELTTKDVAVELGVYTDSSFTAQFPSTDVSKRVELMILKYNGAQMEFSRSETLGYNIKLKIKNLEFWETNPSYYNMSKKLHETLSSFCQGTRNVSHKYDIRCAHTAVPADYGGMAYIGGACTDDACSVDGERSLTGYTALTHEIGHNLGMNHDAGRCYGSDVGIMGGYGAGWSSCSVNDLHNFLQLEKAQCVFREAEALAELSSSLIGQEYSPDDICENRYGPNFFLRKFEYNSHCEAYSCVNLTEGSLYGRMFNHGWQDIPGSYCGEGKICFKLTCTTFADARQTPKIIRPGGWGPWGAWQSCSRTCGVGVTYRRRRCNNPSPINHPGCEGVDSNANEAKICNSEPCSDDSPKQADLIKQRASETCLTMLENKVLNSSEYNSTGDRYSHSGNYVCEVRCKEVGDFKSPYFIRFGLMPHGTPCDAKVIKYMDFMSSPWPRKKGLTPICLEGYCRIFGCDDAFLGGTKEFDECGVCDGDGSTCDVIQGTFTGIPGEGNRTLMSEIPKGAYNIQIWFNYWIMENNFIEMYDKDDVPVIVSHVGNSWVWNTDESKNPVNFANTYWHYKYLEYLNTTGPISEPAIIKLYQKNALENKGIHYAYSLPKTGECKNNGTYNLKLRTCDCPTGFYGADCSSRCNIYCFNGAALDESTCTCQCKEHQTGRYCKCETGYTGKDCTEKKSELLPLSE